MALPRGCILAISLAHAALAAAPTGLLADFQVSPALGVRKAPRFGWIVPPCDAAPDQMQTAYRLTVSSATGAPVWDSGKVTDSDSTYVSYAGPALNASSRYMWSVTTFTESCTSDASDPALFVTSLLGAWDASAQWITVNASHNTFGYFRTVVTIPAGVVSAVVHVTALLEDKLLSGYKLYANDVLLNLGPGRGESPVWEGDGLFRSLPYQTLDVTGTALGTSGSVAIAIQAMHGPPTAIFQLVLLLDSGETVTLVSDASWSALNGDAHRRPGPPTTDHSAGNGFMEYIDARAEPVGWRAPGFVPGAGWAPAVATPPSSSDISMFHARMQPPMQVIDRINVASIRPVPNPPSGPVECGVVDENEVLQLACGNGSPISSIAFASFGTPTGSCPSSFAKGACDANTSLAIVSAACVGKTACSVRADRNVFGDPCYDTVKQLAVQLHCPGTPPPPPPSTSFVADFGREFQGGLRLEVTGGTSGMSVNISCGEAIVGNKVGYTWGWDFAWTLRDGTQVLEQHKYMECRFVSLVFSDTPPTFTLSAWQVHYPFVDTDSSFASSNATLDAVYELCRYTLEGAALDTYTDSNTRERTPYEADGIIAASGRLLVQRDVLWGRHSHAFVLDHPTWPVEWKQITPFLAWQDYMATGVADLALAKADLLHTQTQYSFLDATGVLKTDKMGRHIVDWMPNGDESDQTVARHEFTASPHMSVTNLFAAHGLDLLAQMLTAGGNTALATQYAAESKSLTAAINRLMWNGTAYCDGICSEVGGASLVMSNMFSLAFGMVPPANVDSVWGTVASWGLSQMGDYGAFWYQMAIASGYYGAYYDTPDDGTAIVTALTKCDTYSWCSGLRDDNLTMTRESWHDGTYSHGWGTSAIVGVSWGIMGVHETAPGWASFVVKSKLGSLTTATIKLPTLRGFITITATPAALDVDVPCNTRATLCVPRSSADAGLFTPANTALLLDGAEVPALASGGHLCAASPVGCGAGGAPRRLRTAPRA